MIVPFSAPQLARIKRETSTLHAGTNYKRAVLFNRVLAHRRSRVERAFSRYTKHKILREGRAHIPRQRQLLMCMFALSFIDERQTYYGDALYTDTLKCGGTPAKHHAAFHQSIRDGAAIMKRRCTTQAKKIKVDAMVAKAKAQYTNAPCNCGFAKSLADDPTSDNALRRFVRDCWSWLMWEDRETLRREVVGKPPSKDPSAKDFLERLEKGEDKRAKTQELYSLCDAEETDTSGPDSDSE